MYSLRPLLITYAYNIVGTLEDAKDIVQDAFLKFEFVDKEKIADQKSYLVRIVINLAINFKKKLKSKLVEYPGAWLPEPLDTGDADAVYDRKEILSYSLMVLLEKLDPKQRAVFILREAFDYEHETIADVLGISKDNSRQILRRAKKKLEQDNLPAARKIETDLLNKFMEIIQQGDTNRLEELLFEDITVTSDGGGKAAAFMKPVIGQKQVAALLSGIYKKFYATFRIDKSIINQQPALLYFAENDTLVTCQVLVFENGLLKNVFFMRNPDKLKTLQK